MSGRHGGVGGQKRCAGVVEMSLAPGDGERAALRGYRWQYDHMAALVYDALREDDFRQLRLTDPEVGQVDDLVLVREGRVDAYQFKSTGYRGYLSFSDVAGARRRRRSSESWRGDGAVCRRVTRTREYTSSHNS